MNLGHERYDAGDVILSEGEESSRMCFMRHEQYDAGDVIASEGEEAFRKTMAFQPRQNRGSSGDGIWIIKLNPGSYYKCVGDRGCSDDKDLELIEACDNHAKTHTVDEFMEFCVNDRNDESGKWDMIAIGKYLEGGEVLGGQLVGQRFCAIIVEAEIRLNMVDETVTGIIHKKPKEGGT